MPIRIRCRDKIPDKWYPVKYNGLAILSATYSTASYTDRIPDLRILCESV